MSENRTAALLLLVFHVWGLATGADRSVSCLLQSTCVLPCPFDPGPEVVIHWLKPPDDSSSVHSFYHDKDQLERQRQRYRGRTALFKDQISKGNASLHLTGVELEDRGRYKCYTSTINGNNEDFVNVDVQAPVLQVSMEQEGQQLLCRSEGVYPRPTVVWTPSAEPKTDVYESQGLLSVLSSVTLSESEDTYSCNISSAQSWRSATYRRTDKVSSSGSQTVVPCVEAETDSIKSLVWTFNRTLNILERTGPNTVYDPSWESKLEKVPGSKLVLKGLTQDQHGLYSCALTTERSTYLTVTEVIVKEAAKTPDHTKVITAVSVTAVVVIVLLVAAFFLYKRWCKRMKKSEKPSSKADSSKGEELREKLNPETESTSVTAAQSNGDGHT